MSKADELLREFLSAPKPAWAIATDVVTMAQIILAGDEYPGHGAVAGRSGLHDSKAVMRSLKRLEAAGWIYKHEGGYRAVKDFMQKHKEAFKERPKGELK